MKISNLYNINGKQANGFMKNTMAGKFDSNIKTFLIDHNCHRMLLAVNEILRFYSMNLINS